MQLKNAADSQGVCIDVPGSGSEQEPLSPTHRRQSAEQSLELPEEEVGAAMAFMDAVVKVRI